MRYSEAGRGRVFVARLEHGEVVHEVIQDFCRHRGVNAARVTILGGADTGSQLVVGPKRGEELPPEPMVRTLSGVHEMTGVGTIFPDQEGDPQLHMHVACGRDRNTICGCVRAGVKVWQVAEVLIEEFVDSSAGRLADKKTGFALLHP